jgi:hypothetical protein
VLCEYYHTKKDYRSFDQAPRRKPGGAMMDTEFLPRSEVRRRLSLSDSSLSYYLKKLKLSIHRFGGCNEGMLHQEALDVLTARVQQAQARRYRTQIHYDTWEGYVDGWLVIDTKTDVKHGPYSRNHACYLARKWNRQASAGVA